MSFQKQAAEQNHETTISSGVAVSDKGSFGPSTLASSFMTRTPMSVSNENMFQGSASIFELALLSCICMHFSKAVSTSLSLVALDHA